MCLALIIIIFVCPIEPAHKVCFKVNNKVFKDLNPHTLGRAIKETIPSVEGRDVSVSFISSSGRLAEDVAALDCKGTGLSLFAGPGDGF